MYPSYLLFHGSFQGLPNRGSKDSKGSKGSFSAAISINCFMKNSKSPSQSKVGGGCLNCGACRGFGMLSRACTNGFIGPMAESIRSEGINLHPHGMYSVSPSVCLSICLSVCLSVCLAICPFRADVFLLLLGTLKSIPVAAIAPTATTNVANLE